MALHRAALALLVVTLVVWGAVMAAVLDRADPQEPMVVAVFPVGTSSSRAMLAVSRADGRLVRGTWWPWAFVAHGADVEMFAHRLRGEGAMWVLPGSPFRLAMIGGCGFPVWDWQVLHDG